MLAPTDYEITEVESGEEALAAIAKQQPDLILMDIQLPIMDGYTATPPNQGRPCVAINQDYRGYVLCAQRRGEEGARGGLRRLRSEAVQPTATASENPAIPVLARH
jgi:CheY-like chemotaxis protein